MRVGGSAGYLRPDPASAFLLSFCLSQEPWNRSVRGSEMSGQWLGITLSTGGTSVVDSPSHASYCRKEKGWLGPCVPLVGVY